MNMCLSEIAHFLEFLWQFLQGIGAEFSRIDVLSAALLLRLCESVDIWTRLAFNLYFSESVNFFPTYCTTSLNLSPISCKRFCSLLNFFPNFKCGWIVSLLKNQGICKNIYYWLGWKNTDNLDSHSCYCLIYPTIILCLFFSFRWGELDWKQLDTKRNGTTEG